MKHTSLYGTRIDPNCEYCSHNTTPQTSPNCAVYCEIDENGKCKKFSYDPLLRTPKKRPPLAKFTKEDFKLWHKVKNSRTYGCFLLSDFFSNAFIIELGQKIWYNIPYSY